MTAKQLIRLIEADGWLLKKQKGSHQQYVHSIKKGKVTVPVHGKSEIPQKTVNAILKQAGLNSPLL